MLGREEQLRGLLSKLNDKLEVRLAHVEEKTLKLGKLSHRSEERLNRVENLTLKQVDELKTEVQNRSAELEARAERKIKDLEAVLNRGESALILYIGSEFARD